MQGSSTPITVVFTDIEGSTRLWDGQGDAMRVAHARHNQILTETVGRFDGRVVKDKGDGFMFVFDDPTRAVEASSAIQRALHEEDWPGGVGQLLVRIALSTGVVESRDGDFYGPDVNRAARLEAMAHGGQVLLSESTRALVQGRLPDELGFIDLGRQQLRGITREERVFQLVIPGLPDNVPPPRSAKTRGRPLPTFNTGFFGRGPDVDRLAGMLEDGARLVTLHGAGGIGKTRLAVETARRFETAMPGGIYFADLAPVSGPDGVALAFAESVGIHPEGTADIVDLVAEGLTTSTLVVVDNFEHVVDASPVIARLLACCPDLRLIATSRTPLGIAAERICRISPLPVAGDDEASPAVAMFIDRASVQGITLTDSDEPLVRSICRRLDGLPLAIELVAARTRMLSLADLDRMLSRSLDALGTAGADAPERHRTIRSTIDWSLQATKPSQQSVFARLSALPAGASLAMLEQVCAVGQEGSLLEDIEALVDTSLVHAITDLPGGTRFRQLSLLREYGAELLEAAGETGSTRDRLVDSYVGNAPSMRRRLETSGDADAEIVVDHANLIAAMEWTIESGRAADMADVLLDIWIYWYNGDRLSDLVSWLQRVDSRAEGPALDWLVGFTSIQRGDTAVAAERVRAALDGFRQRGNEHGEALAATFLAGVLEDPGEARTLLDRALVIFERLDDPVGRLVAMLSVSFIDGQIGDFDSLIRLREETLAEAERHDYGLLIAWMRWNLGLAYLMVGRLEDAAVAFGEAFEFMVGARYQEGIASCSHCIGSLEVARGRTESGVVLIAASEAAFERLGLAFWFEDIQQAEVAVEAARAHLGGEAFEAVHSDGRRIGMAELIESTRTALAGARG
jgi:predicted ATPase/class 3 adenylate cyclase